jgi:hypothetical protein
VRTVAGSWRKRRLAGWPRASPSASPNPTLMHRDVASGSAGSPGRRGGPAGPTPFHLLAT